MLVEKFIFTERNAQNDISCCRDISTTPCDARTQGHAVKSPSDPSTHRHSSITSIPFRTFERAVNHHLIHYLKDNGVPSASQHGLRPDCIVVKPL